MYSTKYRPELMIVSTMPAVETEYWIRMLEGDQNAFLFIYKTYYQELFRYGFTLSHDKELTKDCIQELFLELWNNNCSVNKNVHDTRAYLFTWLRRKIYKYHSLSVQQKKKQVSALPHESTQPSYEELLIAFQTNEAEKERLRSALTHLTKKQVEMIKMKFFDNLSYDEIAAKTSLSCRTIYNLIYEGLQRLRADKNLHQ